MKATKGRSLAKPIVIKLSHLATVYFMCFSRNFKNRAFFFKIKQWI